MRNYYPTAPRRVQITPKMSTNITPYLYSRGPVRQVCLLLTNQLAGFPGSISFCFAYLCHAFPVNKYPRNSPARTQSFGVLDNNLDVLLCSITLIMFTRCLYFALEGEGSNCFGITQPVGQERQ